MARRAWLAGDAFEARWAEVLATFADVFFNGEEDDGFFSAFLAVLLTAVVCSLIAMAFLGLIDLAASAATRLVEVGLLLEVMTGFEAAEFDGFCGFLDLLLYSLSVRVNLLSVVGLRLEDV